MRSVVIISRFRQGDTRRGSFIDAQIVTKNFRASAGYAAPSRALPAAARTMAVNSTRGFD
jgi:hypothetical protein